MLLKKNLPYQLMILAVAVFSTLSFTQKAEATFLNCDPCSGPDAYWFVDYSSYDLGGSSPADCPLNSGNSNNDGNFGFNDGSNSSNDYNNNNNSNYSNNSSTNPTDQAWNDWVNNLGQDSSSLVDSGWGNDTSSIWGDNSNSDFGFGSGDSSSSDSFSFDPVSLVSGNKVETARDYSGPGPFPLRFVRTYNSLPMKIPGYVNSLGGNWRGTFDANIVPQGNGDVYLYRPDGKAIKFSFVNGSYQGGNDINATLKVVSTYSQPAGWIYTTQTGTVEAYDANGRLSSLSNRYGLKQTLTYAPNGLLISVADSFGRTLQFGYGYANRLSTLTGPDGSAMQYAYDGSNNLVSVTYPDGSTRGYQYNNSTFPSLMTAKLDAQGQVVASWDYDSQGRAISGSLGGGVAAGTIQYLQDGINMSSVAVTDARGVTRTRHFQRVGSFKKLLDMEVNCGDCDSNLIRTTTYDANGFIASTTDFSGQTIQYTRNARGQALTQTVAAGTSLARTTVYTWHPVFNSPTSIVLPNNRSMHFEYNAQGDLIERTLVADGKSKVWRYHYNNFGQIIRVQAPSDDGRKITTFTYDIQGNLASITNALNQTLHFTQYDNNGRLLSLTDPNGRNTQFTYDANGRRTSVSIGALTTGYAYNWDGQLVSVSRPNGNNTSYAYDSAHRLINVIDARGNTLILNRDLGGHVTQWNLTNANGASIRSSTAAFDQRGRLSQQAGNHGQQVSYRYDQEGRLLAKSDALNRTVKTQFDALRRTTQTIDAQGNAIAFGYDANDYLNRVVSPRGVTTQYQVNGFGQVTRLSSPDTGKTRYEYDTAGHLSEVNDARGNTAHLHYDALGRPLQISFGENDHISFAYDQGQNGIGHLTRITNGSTDNAYQYDSNGNLIQQKQIIGGRVIKDLQYDRTAIGQLSAMHYPSGIIVQYGYSGDGKVDHISVNGTALMSQIQYQADGKIGQWMWGNGQTSSRTFDMDGRMTAYSKAKSSAMISYDNGNRIINLSDSNTAMPTQHFSYNNNDALTSYFAYALNGQTYQYDADGNRTARGGAGMTDYQYASDSNRLLQLSGLYHGVRLDYDASGNIIEDEGNRYAYNARGQLVRVNGAAGSIRYVYDALGQRIAKLSDNYREGDEEADRDDHQEGRAAVTYFTYDPAGHLIGEYSHRQSTEYLWLGNAPVAVFKKNGSESAKLYYIHTDHLGTPRQVTDSASNAMVWEWMGEPFGTSPAVEDPNHTGKKFSLNLRYAGQYYDQESGLFHNGFRDYSPQLGRYVESDPIGLSGGINTYTYVGGNPVSFRDPLGLWLLAIGGQGSFSSSPGTVSAGGGFVISGEGFSITGIGTYTVYGAGPAIGEGGSFGASFAQSSNATTIGQFGGPFINSSAGAGLGPSVSVDAFVDPNSPVTGGGFTIGVGVGGGVSVTTTQTTVTEMWSQSPSSQGCQ